MKALVVDGEELFRLSLKEVISVACSFKEVIAAGSEHEFLTKTASNEDLSLVVIHPGSLHGEGATCMKLVRRLYPNAPVVTVLDGAERPPSDLPGAICVNRSAKVSQVVSAIRRAMKLPIDSVAAVAGRTARPDVLSAMDGVAPAHSAYETDAEPIDLSRLSFRQRQILAMAADGLPNKEIAARLSIAEGTVKAHMHAIFKVLGVSNRTQAVIRYGAAGRPPAPAADATPRRIIGTWNTQSTGAI